MANLSFLDKLDKEQLQNADKVITKAQELGVDPRLALSLAYVESGLRQNKTGGAGEIGIMQVMPATGKLLGYKEEDLRDADKNLEAGLKYLKQNMDRYNNDPILATVAYNAGPDHPFFSGKAKSPPESTLGYVNSIQALGGFEPTPSQAPEEAPVSEAQPTITPASEEDFRKEKAMLAGAGVGAATGAGVSAKRAILGGGPAPVEAAPKSAVQKWAGAMGYEDRGAKTFAQAHEAEQGTRKGANIRNPSTGTVYKPEFKVAKPPIVPPTTGQQIASGLRGIGGFMARNPMLSGALGGASAAAGGMEAMDRYKAGDKLGAGIAGAGALGGGLQMIPTIPTQLLGGLLATASPAALSVLEGMRGATPEQVKRMQTNVDPMGNPLQ
jgi:hypothetical protein